MLDAIKRLAAWLRETPEDSEPVGDPLNHPVLRAMSARDLADLPMPRLTRQRSDACCRA